MMNKLKFLVVIITSVFFIACDDLFEFELPEENSIVDGNSPVSTFNIKQGKGLDWRRVTLTNLSTESLTYDWTLGDGTTKSTDLSSEPWFDHVYDTDKDTEYTITLKASDGSGSSDTSDLTFVLTESLYASFELLQSDAGLDGSWQTVSFTNLSSGTSKYLWDFGDGNTSMEFEPEYTYATNEEALYNVVLTAIDEDTDEEEKYTISFTLEKPKPYLEPEVVSGDFELGDTPETKDPWRTPDFDRIEGEGSVIQISKSDPLEGLFSAKLPSVPTVRCGYQELTLSENINYRISYKYSISNDYSEKGSFNIAIVTPMSAWSDLTANIIANNSHIENNEETGVITESLEFNSGSNTTLAIVFYNIVEEVLIDSIELEGLD